MTFAYLITIDILAIGSYLSSVHHDLSHDSCLQAEDTGTDLPACKSSWILMRSSSLRTNVRIKPDSTKTGNFDHARDAVVGTFILCALTVCYSRVNPTIVDHGNHLAPYRQVWRFIFSSLNLDF